MPIIKQLNATKFRSLKYSNDTSDGGSSRQPYMKVELKDLDKLKINYKLVKNSFLGHIVSIYKNLWFNKKIVKIILMY